MCINSNISIKPGPTYGRNMMSGYLRTQGIHAAQSRFGRILRDVNPGFHKEPVQENS